MIEALKNLPPWAQTLIAWVLLVGGLIFTNWAIFAPPLPRWASVVAGVFVGIGGALGVGIIQPRRIIPILLVGLFVMSSTACTAAVWRTTAAVREAGTLIDKGLSATHKTKREQCKAAHGAKTVAMKKCLDESKIRAAFLKWRRFGMPGLNTGLISTVTTLTLYDKAAGKKLSWDLFIKLIKPLACGLARAATEWKAHLGAQAAAVMGIVSSIKGVSCAQ